MQGRHDLLKAFYFDVLKCAVDPRKEENWGKGAGTLWANCGINQFHFYTMNRAELCMAICHMLGKRAKPMPAAA